MDKRKNVLGLSLAALGIVYGDIGTSPLYAFKVAIQASLGPGGGDPASVAIGIASLIIWSLIVVVSIKYAILIMRADNQGEGGVVAMLALLNARDAAPRSWGAGLLILGLVGAALLYGDGTITPAISVLSAVEGVKVDAPGLAPAVLPITILILIGLFVVQPRGTSFIGRIFGPVMLAWFVAIALIGVGAIVREPRVLAALSPLPALGFMLHAPIAISFAVLGAAFLAVTGGEAMYADMGHFGRMPIRLAWFAVALPALVLNYLGQAALIVATPASLDNPFYGLAPHWAHYPMVMFATLATIIASQAIISGVFSLTQQSVQLGFLPRLRVHHTAQDERGQIYVPAANWLLAAGTLAAVLAFRSSDALAGAYGIAVSGLMAISTFLAALVALRWGFNPVLVALVNGAFFLVDLVFFGANSLKLLEGGWFPLAIAGGIAFLMLTWWTGVHLAEAARAHAREDEDRFVKRLADKSIIRLPGAAAFLTSGTSGIPLSLTRHLHHNRVLQERVLLVSVTSAEIPCVPADERVRLVALAPDLQRVILSFGFMETPDIPSALRQGGSCLLAHDLDRLSYYIGHETIIADPKVPGMMPWRESLFVSMQRNTTPTAHNFCIPSMQVIEVGTEIRI